MIYVNSAGKGADPKAIESLMQRGHVVLAIDPRGWGESAPEKRSSGYSGMWQLAQRAMLIGRPLPGMQVYDVLRAFDYLASRQDVDPSQVSVNGQSATAASSRCMRGLSNRQ